MSVRVMHDVGARDVELGKQVDCPICYALQYMPCVSLWGKESVHSARVDLAQQHAQAVHTSGGGGGSQ